MILVHREAVSEKAKRNVQQHYVTASILGGFTPDGQRDSQLYVYERNSERSFTLPPDKAAKRRNYYSIPTKDGSFDDTVDTMLTKLEEQALPGIRKLLKHDYALTTFERALIAYLIAFQEFRTPWARAAFQQMEITLMEQMMEVGMRAPGYFEHALEKLKAEGKVADSVTADQLRDAWDNEKVQLQAKPHMGIDTMVSTSQTVGSYYTQMKWTVLFPKAGAFLTSDAPVVRRDPECTGGLFGGGLLSSSAEVWFPLSKKACLRIGHDIAKMNKFDELLRVGKRREAEKLRSELPPIEEREIDDTIVQAINSQTIVNADRFVFSPFESDEIPLLLKGESKNFRIVTSRPFGRKNENAKDDGN